MLYEAYELRRTALDLWIEGLEVPVAGLRCLPASLRASYGVRAALAAADVVGALRLTHDRPDFGVRSVMSGGVDVDVHEELVARTPFASLIRFAKADGSSRAQPKVLIVPGLAGHFATLVRATVSTMLADHDVYVADWHNARDVPASAGPFGLDDYIAHLVDFLREMGPGTHVLSVCQPAVACLVAASVMTQDGDPARPSSLMLLAGPVDTTVNPSRISRFAQRQSIPMLGRTMLHDVPRQFAGAGRRVYPGFAQVSGFMAMDPRRHVDAFRGLFRDLTRGDAEQAQKTLDFYREYFAVLDIAGEFYLETAQRIFQDNDLPQGRFTWRGRAVDPSLIDSALFTIEGALDEMCTPGQTHAAHALCTGIPPGRRRHLLQEGVGHYGVFAGSTFEREIYPQIRDFVAEAALPPAGED
ncbi:polyhydroxyalkanoate depolymerase [Nocardioides immobilis]|uniref:Polyhydroxyalkanoate depolymerase n=1 Tax=Nocardioides immobilis TaxID=2049295 RepID=A0A417Y130_9ACTN|nr:polyhydroxyalkanoate depolymerase [Nocardioides immobilis]RHW26359.1 polyhydroxyalkanoate depolymerase [Nocardioides immobilis]